MAAFWQRVQGSWCHLGHRGKRGTGDSWQHILISLYRSYVRSCKICFPLFCAISSLLYCKKFCLGWAPSAHLELLWAGISSDLTTFGCFGACSPPGSLGTAFFPTMQYCEAPSFSFLPSSTGFQTHPPIWRPGNWRLSPTHPSGFWMEPLSRQDRQKSKSAKAPSNRTRRIFLAAWWDFTNSWDEGWQLYVSEGWTLGLGPAVSGSIVGWDNSLQLMAVWGMGTTSQLWISLE